MTRLAKGEVAMFVELWRTNMKVAGMQQADALRAKLEAEMKAGQMSGGLRQMQLIMTGMMRGVKGVALQAMRINMADERRAGELTAMNKASDTMVRSAAIREMRAIMTRLAKGEVAMFVELWRTNMKAALLHQGDALRARLEAEMKAGQQSGALRQMHLIMTGMMRGPKGAALAAMRLNRADEIHVAFTAESHSVLRSAACKMMKSVMLRITKGEIAVCVDIWKRGVDLVNIKAGAALEARGDLMNEIKLLRSRNQTLMEELVALEVRLPSRSKR